MNSIIMAKSKLPIDFLDELENEFSAKIVEKILNGICEKRFTTFRVNTLVLSNDQIRSELKNLNANWEELDLNGTVAFILKNKNEKELQKLDIYKNGEIYLQSISSMIPPIVLNPKEGEKVLDLTAAPGSKTTQMAAMMNNNGKILANEIDKIRCERLKYNLDKQGVKIAEVINEDGINVGKKYENQFDKVLIDAPCSGEGRFLLDEKDSYSKWSPKMVKELSALQIKLIESAVKACKVGGEIVYSTCTLNREEDEKIVDYAIKNLNVELEKIDLKIKKSIHGNSKGVDKSIEKTLKMIPSAQTEGFYIAKFLKK